MEICIFVFQFLSILIAFSLLIYTNWFILKLTILFNWVLLAYTRNHHGSILGLQGPSKRASSIWKNWTIRIIPLNSWRSTESKTSLALFLYAANFYSLFFSTSDCGGLKPPLFSLFFSGKNANNEEEDQVSRHGWLVWISRENHPLTLVLHYVICFLYYIQSAWMAQWQGTWFGKQWDLGSIPRSPYPFNIIFSNIILCSFSPKDHHALHNLSLPHGL